MSSNAARNRSKGLAGPKAPASLLAALAVICALAMAASSARSGLAQAPNNPIGLWTIAFFDDNNPTMPETATQTLCFLGDGTWFSPSFGGLHGLWFQKGSNGAGNGDLVSVIGNLAGGFTNEGAELELVNLNQMNGTWNEWFDNLGFINWTRAAVTRAGGCNAQSPTTKQPAGARTFSRTTPPAKAPHR